MINLFVFNLKHLREGIISFQKKGAYPGISLKLTFESEFGIYYYVFTKDSYKDSYLEKIGILLSRIYANADQGNTFMALDFDKDGELYLSDTREYIFDRVNILERDRDKSYNLINKDGELYLSDTREYIFDRVNILERDKSYNLINHNEYLL